ncbi:MAG: 4-hydroxythreonine-4-phosphate dehydrogenase PdxA [bacterium]
MKKKPLIALTMGDPAGIGPELCLRMMLDKEVRAYSIPVIFGDAELLRRVAKLTGLRVPRTALRIEDWFRTAVTEPCLVDIPCPDLASIAPGRVSAAGGMAACRCVEFAVREAMARRVVAIVTAPLNKESLHRAGLPYPGHTEMLGAFTGTAAPCMMLSSEKITTSLVTTHTGIAGVTGQLTLEGILRTIRLTAATMERLRRRTPKLVVCALNPHAGEHGLFGDEEARLIEPAIAAARAEGLDIEGPLPPDTAFLPDRLARTSAFICMYHDQGLIPFKMLAFETGVNLTLGLPITRTSPDHGTAFDIAWTGRANPASMRQAVLYAVQLS